MSYLKVKYTIEGFWKCVKKWQLVFEHVLTKECEYENPILLYTDANICNMMYIFFTALSHRFLELDLFSLPFESF